ncbi:MAG: hypothetical protein IPQ03_00190 [Bacteroidetes bacterium]|nr:hypothetical protein [Bacteroidota bacterium]
MHEYYHSISGSAHFSVSTRAICDAQPPPEFKVLQNRAYSIASPPAANNRIELVTSLKATGERALTFCGNMVKLDL